MKDSIFRIFAGTLGSYKSYHGVLEMLETWKTGGIVFTNIEIIWERVKLFMEDEHDVIVDDKQLVYISFEECSNFAERLTKGTMERPNRLVLDEAAITQNAKDHKQANELSRDMIRHARKLHIDTVFIAHDFYEIDKQMRNKAQSVTWHRDMQKVKFAGFHLPFPFWVSVEVDARNPKLKYDSGCHRKDKRIYKLYKSHDVQSQAAHAIGESPEIDLKTIERSKRPSLLRPIRRFAFMGLAGFGLWSWLGGSSEAEKPQQVAQEPVKVAPVDEIAAPRPRLVHYQPKQPEKPEPLMVSGYVIRGDKVTVWLTDGRMITEHTGQIQQVNSRRGVLVEGEWVPMKQYRSPERPVVTRSVFEPPVTVPVEPEKPAEVTPEPQDKPLRSLSSFKPYRAFGGLPPPDAKSR